jgi:adenosylcobinamide-phosphate synthase
MVLAAGLLGEDWRKALETLRRDRSRTPSINAGWPLSAMAGALGVRLEKPGFYALGDGASPLKPEHIFRSLRIMKLTAYLFIGLVVIPVAVGIITVIG